MSLACQADLDDAIEQLDSANYSLKVRIVDSVSNNIQNESPDVGYVGSMYVLSHMFQSHI